MVLVSHDRHLLRLTCDRLLLVHAGRVDEFSDELDAYPAWLSAHLRSSRQDSAAQAQSVSANQRRERKRDEADRRKALQPLKKALGDCEALLERLQTKQAKLEAGLADTAIYAEQRKDELQGLLREKAALGRELAKVEQAWMEAAEALEQADN